MKKDLGQLEALLSRAGDNDLTADERARVDREIAATPSAAGVRVEYERLGHLLAGWRRLTGKLDLSSLRRDVSARIADQLAERASSLADRRLDPQAVLDEGASEDTNLGSMVREMAAVDSVVRQSAGEMPEADWSAFKARVSSAVRAEAERSGMHVKTRSRIPGGVKWFAPIAAAAVIAIAVFQTGTLPGPGGIDPSPAPIVVVELDVPNTSGRIQFAFDEGPPPNPEDPALPGTAIARSSSSAVVGFDDAELMY